jgi:hypothetical protein
VTEPELGRNPSASPRGVRVGHVYETWFAGGDAVATHVLDERARLERASTELSRLVADSSLPAWLGRAIVNSIDSTLCNTVVPASGALYTLEGMDWGWAMGALTGTMDQRLSAHPYASVFFPDLDLRELDEFRRLADARGAVPHGNGNADLALGSTDVPYGWPLVVKDFLPAKEWTDLTMSFVLQVGKVWRTTGRADVLERFWPTLVAGMEHLNRPRLAACRRAARRTTSGTSRGPSSTARPYLATLRTMIAVASHADPARVEGYRARHALRRAHRCRPVEPARLLPDDGDAGFDLHGRARRRLGARYAGLPRRCLPARQPTSATSIASVTSRCAPPPDGTSDAARRGTLHGTLIAWRRECLWGGRHLRGRSSRIRRWRRFTRRGRGRARDDAPRLRPHLARRQRVERRSPGKCRLVYMTEPWRGRPQRAQWRGARRPGRTLPPRRGPAGRSRRRGARSSSRPSGPARAPPGRPTRMSRSCAHGDPVDRARRRATAAGASAIPPPPTLLVAGARLWPRARPL